MIEYNVSPHSQLGMRSESSIWYMIQHVQLLINAHTEWCKLWNLYYDFWGWPSLKFPNHSLIHFQIKDIPLVIHVILQQVLSSFSIRKPVVNFNHLMGAIIIFAWHERQITLSWNANNLHLTIYNKHVVN